MLSSPDSLTYELIVPQKLKDGRRVATFNFVHKIVSRHTKRIVYCDWQHVIYTFAPLPVNEFKFGATAERCGPLRSVNETLISAGSGMFGVNFACGWSFIITICLWSPGRKRRLFICCEKKIDSSALAVTF